MRAEKYRVAAASPALRDTRRSNPAENIWFRKHRADLTCLAVACGAKGIFTEKPMAHTLEEAGRGGEKVSLPLPDRSVGLNYDWFR